MKDGDIIEQGNHEELLQKNGFYAQLYNSQFEEASEIKPLIFLYRCVSINKLQP